MLLGGVVLLGWLGSILALQFDEESSGPPLVDAVGSMPAAEGMELLDNVALEEPRGLTEELALEVVDPVCGEAAAGLWATPAGDDLVLLMVCRTGGTASAQQIGRLQLRWEGCVLDEQEFDDGDPRSVTLTPCVANTDTPAEWTATWSNSDIAIMAFGSATLEEAAFIEWIEAVDEQLDEAGYSAPLFAQPAVVAGGAIGFGLTALLALIVIRAALRWLRSRKIDVGSGGTYRCDATAKQLRWFGRFFGVTQGAAFVLLPLPFLALLGPLGDLVGFRFSSPLSVIISIGAIAAMTAGLQRLDGDRHRWMMWAPRTPLSTVLTLAGAISLLLGMAIYVVLAIGRAFPLDYSSQLPPELRDAFSGGVAIFFIFGIVPLATISAAASLFRAALRRRLARSDPDQFDPGESILFLRSFTDDRLRVRAAASARRGLTDAWTVRATDRFEEVVNWELASIGPLVAVSDRNALGAARIKVLADEWRDWVQQRQHSSRLLVCVLGDSGGLRWEIDQIARNGHLHKTLFVIPPVPEAVILARWAVFTETLASAGISAKVDINDVTSALVAIIRADGSVQSLAADRRDEAGYRAAIQAGVAVLDSNDPSGY